MKRLISCALALITALSMTLMLAACSKDVTVSIADNGSISTVMGKDDMTVAQLLQSGGITLGQQDVVTPPLDTVWKDANADSITIQRSMKVKVTDGTKQIDVEMMGGTVAEAVAKAGFDITQYHCEADADAPIANGMTIRLAPIENDGFVEDETGKHYYSGGVMMTSTVVGDETEGYFYVNEQGIVDEGYVDGVNVDGQDWIVINGVATQVVTDSDKTLCAAAKDIAKCTTSTMTKDEKLKAAFDYIRENYLEGVPHDPPYRESDWPVVCANDIFVNGKGDCFSYGAAFAYMCRAIGCSEVYACNSGGHGWAQAEGKVYDPEWSMHSDKYSYYAVAPGDEVDVAYWTTANEDWQRKAIELNQTY